MTIAATSSMRGFLLTSAGAAALMLVALINGLDSTGSVALAAGVALAIMATLIWPFELLTVAYPFVWPLFGMQIAVGAATLSPERVVALAAGLGMLAAIALKRVIVPLFPMRVALASAAVLCSQFASALISDSPQIEPIAQLMQKFVLAWLAFLLASEAARLRLLIRLMIAGAVVTAFSAAALAWSSGNFDALMLARSGEIVDLDQAGNQIWVTAARASHVGQYAVWMALALAAVTAGRVRAGWSVLAGLLLVAESFVLRRQVLLSALLLFPFLVVFRRFRVRAQAATIILLAAAAFVFVIVPTSELWQSRLRDETVRAIQEYDDPRLELVTASYAAFNDAPLFGSGPGTFVPALLRYPELLPTVASSGEFAPHNSFTVFMVEGGAVGLIAIIALLFATAMDLHRASRLEVQTEAGMLVRYWPIIFTQVMVWSMLGHGLYLNLSWFLLGIMLGAAALVRRQARVLHS